MFCRVDEIISKIPWWKQSPNVYIWGKEVHVPNGNRVWENLYLLEWLCVVTWWECREKQMSKFGMSH